MTKNRSIFAALMCAFETYLFNKCLLEDDYLFAFFWGILLSRGLKRTYKIDKLIHALTSATKKKD